MTRGAKSMARTAASFAKIEVRVARLRALSRARGFAQGLAPSQQGRLPVDHNCSILGAVAVAYLLAGFVKGVIGLGLPTVAIGLLGLLMTPAQAAAILVVPSLVTNIWQCTAGGDVLALVRRMWPLLARHLHRHLDRRRAVAERQRRRRRRSGSASRW